MARNYSEVNTTTFSFFHFHFYFFSSEPTKDSKRFVETFPLPEGGEVKAKAFVNNFSGASAVVMESFDICPAKWKVVDADSLLNQIQSVLLK